MRAFKQQPSDAPDEDLSGNHARIDAVRSWLASGNHIFGVDPRRRQGHHGHARQLLAEDLRESQGSAGDWQALASALDRHTVRGGMAQLSADERKVITLAYLEGRTNREIAQVLGVSVSTVRRRLWMGLKRLDAYISRTRSWLSAFLVLGAAYVLDRTAKLGRSVDVDWTHKVASTVAVGAVAAAAIGLTAISPDSIKPQVRTHPAAPAPAATQDAGVAAPQAHISNLGPVQLARMVSAVGSGGVKPKVKPAPKQPVTETQPVPGAQHPNHGCGGNPTSAAPQVPVGSHSHQPRGAPVTHPTAGGCRT